MKEEQLRQMYTDCYDSVTLDEKIKQQLIAAAAAAPVRRERKIRFVFAMALAILSIGTALAAVLTPSITAWLKNRADATRLSQEALPSFTPATVSLAGVSFTIVEAVADDRSFAANIKVECPGAIVYPLFEQQNKTNPQNETAVYVDAQPFMLGKDSEITKTEAADDGSMYIISEGWQICSPQENIEIQLTVVKNGKTYEQTISQPVTWMATTEDYTLKDNIPIGETRYILTALNLHRTAWRTYLDYTFEVRKQPLEYAIKRPIIQLADENGTVLQRYWDYWQDVPVAIYVQVWDEAHDNLLYQQELVLDEITSAYKEQ